MKKCFLTVPALFFLAGTVFSEISLSPGLSLSAAIDSRTGLLFYEKGGSSGFLMETMDADLKTKDCCLSLGGRYLYGKSPHNVLKGSLSAADLKLSFSKDFYTLRAGGGSFSLPGALKILGGKPRFNLDDTVGFFLTMGATADFYFLDERWSLAADGLFGKAGAESGDMYYFYGKPDKALLLGGRAKLSSPLGFELLGFGGCLGADLETDKAVTIGKSDARLGSLFLAKTFSFPCLDLFSLKPFAGYAYLSLSGNALLTAESQTYALFPYRRVGGDFSEEAHFISLGSSLDIKKGGFGFSLDFLWLFCVKCRSLCSYEYMFKKNIFFDGSSDSGSISLPDLAGLHIFAGMAEASYTFSSCKHLSPTLRLTKMLAAAVINQETRDFFSSAFSSYSTVTSPSPENSSGKASPDTLKRALLSGTSLSLKIGL